MHMMYMYGYVYICLWCVYAACIRMYACIYICVCTWVYIHMYMRAIYVCMYSIYIYQQAYMYIDVCMHTYTCVSTICWRIHFAGQVPKYVVQTQRYLVVKYVVQTQRYLMGKCVVQTQEEKKLSRAGRPASPAPHAPYMAEQVFGNLGIKFVVQTQIRLFCVQNFFEVRFLSKFFSRNTIFEIPNSS